MPSLICRSTTRLQRREKVSLTTLRSACCSQGKTSLREGGLLLHSPFFAISKDCGYSAPPRIGSIFGCSVLPVQGGSVCLWWPFVERTYILQDGSVGRSAGFDQGGAMKGSNWRPLFIPGKWNVAPILQYKQLPIWIFRYFTEWAITSQTISCWLGFGCFHHCCLGDMPVLPDYHMPKQNGAGKATFRLGINKT